ncbi:E3 ubiquitin-protein ligase RHA2A-like [Neltuma alba]|uniref:E3 ubiquitin-protein ligase RHA2A-like n=1 Tax=Neltuma alba TaxID=207710 RepID=UPI0010A36343|nr:E3 ubiquitin-protein ligase RHA2A-like [Prosopis alba]XP_028758156.1 E3 ubiquitin-protein ligase RHA2A-like [Prosopis alba]XP_028781989.1 E3 ubiquitin-protein ligase RHA2A-like [Prosopis alba]
MGLQNQLNDVASDSIPLLFLALVADCLHQLRSFLITLFQSLGLSRFDPNPVVVDDGFFAAVGSGLASLIVLSEQLNLNRRVSYRYSIVGGGDDGPAGVIGSPKCVVCQSSFEDGDQVRRLPCRHVFHRCCFDGWLDHLNFNCPLCRTPLVSDERVTLAERRVGPELVSWFSCR